MGLLDHPLTDAGNAERIAELHADHIRFCTVTGWANWAGTHWQTADHTGQHDAALHTTRELYAHAQTLLAQTPGDPFATALAAFARKGESRSSLDAALALASRQAALFTPQDHLDADPNLLNTANGTLDLRNTSLRAPQQADLISRVTPARIDGFPGDTAWQQFLTQILPDPELRAYVQRAVGASLFGVQREHVVFIAYGTGANGKGTFFRALEAALGRGYHTTLASNALIETPQPPHPTEIAGLRGKRLAVTAEIARDKQLDEAKLKELTGDDTIKARYMHKDFMEFRPSHTLWICTNAKPRIKGTDKGIWRRLRLLPFCADIAVLDPDLSAKLEAERDGILGWAAEGARLYWEQGLGTCAAVDTATDEYRTDQDFFGQALTELCETGHGCQVAKSAFREAISLFYRAAGFDAIPTDMRVKAELDQRGYADKQTTGGARVWCGIALKPLVLANLRDQAEAMKPANKQSRWGY